MSSPLHDSSGRLAWLLVVSITACGSSPGEGGAHVTGGVQKGPFVIGSSVQVAVLDPTTGNPTGIVFNTTTRTDLGEFDLVLSESGAVEIITSGYYFNELSGELSGSPLTLRALAQIGSAGPQSVFVNAVTQMSYQRAKKLIADGAAFADAIRTAEGELETALGLPVGPSVGSGTSMNLLGGDADGNAYLFALSCLIAQAAQNEAPSSPDAKLQELVSRIALDLEADGALDGAMTGVLARARKNLDPGRCTRNMRARLLATGSGASLPDIYRAVDFDEDGIPDASDPDADGDGLEQERLVSVHETPAGRFAIDEGGMLWRWDPAGVPAVLPMAPASQVVAKEGTEPFVLARDGTVWRAPIPGAPARFGGLEGVSGLAAEGHGVVAAKGDGTVWLALDGEPTSQVSGLADVILARGNATGGGLIVLERDGTVWAQPCSGPPGSVAFRQVPGVSGAVTIGGFDVYASVGDIYRGVAVTEAGVLWTWRTKTCDEGFLPAEQLATDVRDVSPRGDCVVKKDGTVWVRHETTLAQIPGPSDVVAVSDRCAIVLQGDGAVRQAADDGTYDLVPIPH